MASSGRRRGRTLSELPPWPVISAELLRGNIGGGQDARATVVRASCPDSDALIRFREAGLFSFEEGLMLPVIRTPEGLLNDETD